MKWRFIQRAAVDETGALFVNEGLKGPSPREQRGQAGRRTGGRRGPGPIR